MKNRRLVPISVIVVLLSLFIGSTVIGCSIKSEHISLDGKSYSYAPTVGDFMNNGWSIEEASLLHQIIGENSESSEWISDPDSYPNGEYLFRTFRLVNGDESLSIVLNDADREDGLDITDCRIDTLEILGGDIKSLKIDGQELFGTESAKIERYLGTPDEQDEGPIVSTYWYAMADKNIDGLSLVIDNTLNEVIYVILTFRDPVAD